MVTFPGFRYHPEGILRVGGENVKRYLSSKVPNQGMAEIVKVVEQTDRGIVVIIRMFESAGWINRERFYPWTSVHYIETRED